MLVFSMHHKPLPPQGKPLNIQYDQTLEREFHAKDMAGEKGNPEPSGHSLLHGAIIPQLQANPQLHPLLAEEFIGIETGSGAYLARDKDLPGQAIHWNPLYPCERMRWSGDDDQLV